MCMGLMHNNIHMVPSVDATFVSFCSVTDTNLQTSVLQKENCQLLEDTCCLYSMEAHLQRAK